MLEKINTFCKKNEHTINVMGLILAIVVASVGIYEFRENRTFNKSQLKQQRDANIIALTSYQGAIKESKKVTQNAKENEMMFYIRELNSKLVSIDHFLNYIGNVTRHDESRVKLIGAFKATAGNPPQALPSKLIAAIEEMTSFLEIGLKGRVRGTEWKKGDHKWAYIPGYTERSVQKKPIAGSAGHKDYQNARRHFREAISAAKKEIVAGANSPTLQKINTLKVLYADGASLGSKADTGEKNYRVKYTQWCDRCKSLSLGLNILPDTEAKIGEEIAKALPKIMARINLFE